MRLRDELQTIAVAYADICQGQDPWVALGNFMNDWFDYAKDRREQLVADPPAQPDASRPETHRRATFCAASVEWLCDRYDVPCPAWVHAALYHLSEPWFFAPQEQLHERLAQKTPEPFKRRNIYCGNRVFANKYELAEQVQHLRRCSA
jgi:hypothetical protein